MKKRLSIILAMTVFAVSLPGIPTGAAEDAVILGEVEPQPEAVEATGKSEASDVTSVAKEGEDAEISKPTENQESTGTSGFGENDSILEPVKDIETSDSVEKADDTEVSEATENPESTEVPESTESSDDTETVESTENPDDTEIIESTENPDDTEVSESTEVPDNTEVSEPTDSGYPSDIISDADFTKITEEIGLFQIPQVRESTVTDISVSNAAELLAAARQVNNLTTSESTVTYNITLTENIDLTKISDSTENVNLTSDDSQAETGTSWIGFGTSEYPFRGSFNGNGHTVTLADGSTALFHYTENATIKNVIVKCAGSIAPVTITGTDKNGVESAAGIVANLAGGIIQNSGNLAAIKASSAEAAGGVVGYAKNFTGIYDCWNGATVEGGSYSGGIVGKTDRIGNANTMHIYGCNNYGVVSGVHAGGIAGYLRDNVNLYDAYNGGTVNGASSASGIAGEIAGSAEIVRVVNGGKVVSLSGTVNPVFQYTGSDENRDLSVVKNTCYDSTLNPGEYTWPTGGITGKTTEEFATGKAIDDWGEISTGNIGGKRDWRKNAGSYPICVKNDSDQASTFPEQAIRAATDTAYIVTAGEDTYLCLTNYGENKYTRYGNQSLQQFSDINVTEADMSLTYSEDGYERTLPLTKSGNMTVIYGKYDNSRMITLDGTFDTSSSYYQDTVYHLPYGTKIDATATLTGKTGTAELLLQSEAGEQSQEQDGNQKQNPAQETITWQLMSKDASGLHNINLTQDNTSYGKLTGQINVKPSENDTYTITLTASCESGQITSWCVKKIQVKVVKAAAEFEWKVNDVVVNTLDNATYNNSPYTVEAARTDKNDYTGLSVEPKVNIIYYSGIKNSESNKTGENNKLAEAPKNAGSYTVEMQPDAGTTGTIDTTDYYTYTCPEKASFTINPKKLTNSTDSTQNGYTIKLDQSEIIIEGTDWKTEDTKNTVTIHDKTLDQDLKSGKDYTVTYTNTSEPGTATATIEGKGNYYTANPIKLTYQIKEVLSADMFHFTDTSKITVILGKDSQKELPVIGTGKMTGKTLTEGTDYTVSYENTDKPGTATVTIQGGTNGKYIIEKDKPVTLQYSVKKLLTKDMFVLENTDPVTLGEGKEQKKVTGMDNEFRPETSLVEGKDYTLTYSGTDKPGTATLTVQAVEDSDYVTDQDNPIQFRYNIMLGSSKAELDTGSYKLGNPGMWYLKEQPDVHYYGEIDFYVPSLRNYQFFHVDE